MTFINLTNHDLQPEQIAEGCTELPTKYKNAFKNASTLVADSAEELEDSIQQSVHSIVSIAQRFNATKCLVGGHPGLMTAVIKALKGRGIETVMAHTDRVSVDMPDGTKVSKFQHKFFYNV